MSREEYIKFYISLLELEIEALRSVVSEYGSDHNGFTQWIKAECIKVLKLSLVKP